MKSNHIFVLNIVVLVTVPVSYANVYLLSFANSNEDIQNLISEYVDGPLPKRGITYQRLKKTPNLIDPLTGAVRKRCTFADFVSGTESQKLRCLKTIKNKSYHQNGAKSDSRQQLTDSAYFGDQFYHDNDFSQGSKGESESYSLRQSRSEPDDISIDYWDFRYMRPIHLTPSKLPKTSRKRNSDRKPSIKKRNMNVEIPDDDYDSDQEPKRFQIVNNKKKKLKKHVPNSDHADYSSSVEEQFLENTDVDSDGSDEASVEIQKPIRDNLLNSNANSEFTDSLVEIAKPKRGKVKNVKIDTLSSDSESVEDEEITKKEFYLQGNKVINSVSDRKDEDYRRRLASFLPKRFHWDEDDIHNLGYFWFDGPQGKYPYYAVRP